MKQGLPSQEVVDHVYNYLLKNPDFYHVEPKSGFPQKLSPEDGQFTALKLARGHVKTTIDLQHEFFPHVHPNTVCSYL